MLAFAVCMIRVDEQNMSINGVLCSRMAFPFADRYWPMAVGFPLTAVSFADRYWQMADDESETTDRGGCVCSGLLHGNARLGFGKAGRLVDDLWLSME